MDLNGKLGVCMVTVAFYPDVGGIQMNVYSLAQHLVEMGVDVIVITRRMNKDVPLYEELDGIRVFRLDIPREMSKAEALARFLWGARKVMARHAKDFQVIHSHQLVSPTTIGLVAKETLRKKLVATPHTPSSSASFHSLVHKRPVTGKPRLKWMQKRADAFVAISQEIESDLVRLGFPAEKITYIPNGIDTRRFSPVQIQEKAELRNKLGLPDGDLITFVGRLVARKQVDVLLRAFKGLRENGFGNTAVLVLGEGPEMQSLQDLAADLGVAEQTFFLGSRLNTEAYLQTSDVFVLPSSSEGMPIALLEAMSSGVACVGSRIGGIVDLIADGKHGLLAESGNEVDLQKQLETLLQSADLRKGLGKNARGVVVEQFDMTATAKTYLDLYRSVLELSHKSRVVSA
jgi:glycosyltransferase involved in cell wall biosynthesis